MNRRQFLSTGWGAAVFATGCGALMEAGRLPPFSADNPLALEAADTVGYGLGLLAAKDSALKQRIEGYYSLILTGDITPAVINAAVEALKAEGVEYRFLAYRVVRMARLLGAQVTRSGTVTGIGKIDPDLIEAGKQGYLTALAHSGISY